ncbi:MAG: hypothetical protein JO257_25440 [Deltaproteobacteria bacterium]|nr:hypothetical protein [Deltaproteobacteria bacterium]
MAYFADLTRYAYGRTTVDDAGDLNVGWLERNRDFERGDAPGGLVDALLLCATRPARSKRGYHGCDLCPSLGSFVVTSMALDGRQVRLGNGEVRVRGAEGQWYAAPTLVAHYVAQHRYLPPAPFVAAVLRRAREFYVVADEQLARLTALSIDEQLEVCIRAIAAFPTSQPDVLAAVCEELRRRDAAPLRGADKLDMLSDAARHACWETFHAFTRLKNVSDEERQSLARACVVCVLELASDLGVDAAAF